MISSGASIQLLQILEAMPSSWSDRESDGLAGLGETHYRVAENMFTERLLKDLVEAAGKRTFLEVGGRECSDQHRGSGPTPRAKARKHLEAVEIVHAVVGDETARIVRERIREEGSAGGISADIEASCAQQQLQGASNARIIFHEQKSGTIRRGSSETFACHETPSTPARLLVRRKCQE